MDSGEVRLCRAINVAELGVVASFNLIDTINHPIIHIIKLCVLFLANETSAFHSLLPGSLVALFTESRVSASSKPDGCRVCDAHIAHLIFYL
jgi:hypothetical protein